MGKENEVKGLFPEYLRSLWSSSTDYIKHLQEIRIRVNQPIILNIKGTETFLTKDGFLTYKRNKGFCVTRKDVNAIFAHICKYSVYAFEDEIKQGFLSVEGGHRIGIGGQVVLENEQIRTIKNISYLNMRISHEIQGVSNEVFQHLVEGQRFLNTLIISPPGCGKTTLLRDLVRNISDGTDKFLGVNVGVVDERSEIGGSFLGVAQNYLGIRTDLLDSCPKALGMIMLIRSMSPNVIAVDELGSIDDAKAIGQIIQSGCSLLATIHGENIAAMREKVFMKQLLEEEVFLRYIVLSNKKGVGTIEGIYNKELDLCCKY